MKLLLTTIAAVVLVGCGESQQSAPVAGHQSYPVSEVDSGLLDAASDGDIKAVKQHLAAGMDFELKCAGCGGTALLHAAFGGHKEIVELLIAKGADVNAKGSSGWTPLHFAANGGYMEVTKLLIAKGVDVNAIIVSGRNQGKTPLDWAEDVENLQRSKTKVAKKETADLLRKHGGKTGEELKAEGK